MAGASCNLSEELSSELEALESIYSEEGEFLQELSETPDYVCVVNLNPNSMCVGLQISIPGKFKVHSKTEIS